MAIINVVPWTGSTSGTLVYAYPADADLNNYTTSPNRILLPEDNGRWPISLEDTISRFWLLFEGSSQPASKNLAVFVVDLQEVSLDNQLPDAITVAIPQVLENAGYDPTNIVRYRGTTWNILFENLGVLTDVNELWFTLRKRQTDSDDNSLVQISSVSGMLRSNRLAPDLSSNASVTIIDNIVGNVLVTIKANETTKYLPTDQLNYDIKVERNNGNVDIIQHSSKFRIVGDVTRKIT